MTSDYLMIFTMGLFGSLHCMGMCGGLIMACSMKFGKASGGFGFSLLYNAGRIFTYALIGLFMGLFGKELLTSDLFMLRQILPIIAGGIMILIGLDILGIFPAALKRYVAKLLPKKTIDGLITRQLKQGRSPALVLGMLNGLIPCGLVYAAALKASTMGSALSGLMIMLSLGLGTLLPLLFIGTLTTKKLLKRGRVLSILSSVILIVLGIKAIYFGIGAEAVQMHGHI
jgi:hypothetical protein